MRSPARTAFELESEDGHANVRLDWDGKAKKWLLTAFEKRAGAGTRTDTASTRGAGDTARRAAGPEEDATAQATQQQNGVTDARIEAAVAPITARWQGDDVPRVRVVATPEQLPDFAKVDAAGRPDPSYRKARGMYDGHTIYVVASAHDTTPDGLRQLRRTLTHEAVGHYGIERIVTRELGADAWAKITAATERLRANPGTASPRIREVLAALNSRYADVDADTYAKEFLAVSSEQGVHTSLLERAVAALRAFVRRWFPDLSLSPAELRQLLVQSKDYIERGQTQGQKARAALAFSKAARSAFTDAQRFAQAVTDFAANRLAPDKAIQVTEGTPDVLRQLGMQDLPIEITAREMTKVLHGPAVTDGKHGLGKTVLQQLVRQLHEPVAVFASFDEKGQPRPDARVLLTELKDADGQPVMVAIQMNREAESYRINSIRSVYGRPERQYQNWVRDGRLRYIDQSKTPEWLTTGELQLLKAGSPSRASGQKLLTDADIVKPFTSGHGQYDQAPPVDTPAFRTFFNGSKVVDAAGEPLVLYHGTADDFNVFRDDHSGEATGHATSALGHFLTPDLAQAQGYACNASDGRPADERVIDAYVSIKKPYTMRLKEAQGIETKAQARALRAKLEAEGYDGIHLPEQNAWVAFDSRQIKSASENRGAFDPANPDIRFARNEDSVGGALPGKDVGRRGLPVENVDRLARRVLKKDPVGAGVHTVANFRDLPPALRQAAAQQGVKDGDIHAIRPRSTRLGGCLRQGRARNPIPVQRWVKKGSSFTSPVPRRADARAKVTPVVSPRDTPASGERATSAYTGVDDFVRQRLHRVNPDVGSCEGALTRPLVLRHGAAGEFNGRWP